MKKLFTLFISIVVFASCSKSSSAPNTNNNNTSQGTLTADIDGVSTNFNVEALAGHENGGGMYSVFVAGYVGDPTSSDRLQVNIIDEPVAIGTGTYYDNNAITKYNVAIDYFTVPDNIAFVSDGLGPDTAVVTITSIDTTSMTGTFSGGVISTASASHVITNGKFSLKFSS